MVNFWGVLSIYGTFGAQNHTSVIKTERRVEHLWHLSSKSQLIISQKTRKNALCDTFGWALSICTTYHLLGLTIGQTSRKIVWYYRLISAKKTTWQVEQMLDIIGMSWRRKSTWWVGEGGGRYYARVLMKLSIGQKSRRGDPWLLAQGDTWLLAQKLKKARYYNRRVLKKKHLLG